MSHIRSSVVRLAAGVVLAQLVFLAVAAVAPVVCCTPALTADALPDCCRGETHVCPLSGEAEDEGDSVRSCPKGDERIAVLLFDMTGVLSGVLRPLHVPVPTEVVEDAVAFAPAAFAFVESPPPRA